MRALACREWGIKVRVILIATVPLVLMFLSTLIYSYHSRATELEKELNEGARLIASLLAESAEYGVVSENLSYMDRTARWLLSVDNSIWRVEVLDSAKRPLMQITNDKVTRKGLREFEAPISREALAVSTFDFDDQPEVSEAPDKARTSLTRGPTVGYVRVSISPSARLAKQRERTLVGSAIALTALTLSVLLGLALAIGLTRPLSKTIAAVRSIRRGEFAVRMNSTAGGELGELQAAIMDMAGDLDRFRRDLEGQVLARTRELEVARDDAVKSNTERMRLIQKVNSAIEEERRYIANEIHDHLNAQVILVRLEAQRILKLASKEDARNALRDIAARAQAILDCASQLYEMARDIVRRLRPEVIDTLGLRDALEEMVGYYDRLHPQVRFAFHADGDFSELTSETSIAAYRLVQEALSNVVKHSGATSSSVRLLRPGGATVLRIEVLDNGKGFDRERVEPGIGLIGMRERVHGLDGTLEISSAENSGTQIRIDLPTK